MAMRPRLRPACRPEGPNHTSLGQRPRSRMATRPSPEGAAQSGVSLVRDEDSRLHVVSPLQGLFQLVSANPGRCPGLSYCAPLGLTNARRRLGLGVLLHCFRKCHVMRPERPPCDSLGQHPRSGMAMRPSPERAAQGRRLSRGIETWRVAVSPLQGLIQRLPANPGRCPGLGWVRPSGHDLRKVLDCGHAAQRSCRSQSRHSPLKCNGSAEVPAERRLHFVAQPHSKTLARPISRRSVITLLPST